MPLGIVRIMEEAGERWEVPTGLSPLTVAEYLSKFQGEQRCVIRPKNFHNKI